MTANLQIFFPYRRLKPCWIGKYFCQQKTFGKRGVKCDLLFSELQERVHIPIKEVGRILVLGRVQISTSAIEVCLEHQIPVIFMSQTGEMHLAFDLMEEWRSPIVDSLVMWLVNKKVIRPTDFTFPNAEGGVYLESAARRVFLKHFEDRITEEITHPAVQQPVSYRRAIQLQIQQYKRCLQNSKPYTPFIRAV